MFSKKKQSEPNQSKKSNDAVEIVTPLSNPPNSDNKLNTAAPDVGVITPTKPISDDLLSSESSDITNDILTDDIPKDSAIGQMLKADATLNDIQLLTQELVSLVPLLCVTEPTKVQQWVKAARNTDYSQVYLHSYSITEDTVSSYLKAIEETDFEKEKLSLYDAYKKFNHILYGLTGEVKVINDNMIDKWWLNHPHDIQDWWNSHPDLMEAFKLRGMGDSDQCYSIDHSCPDNTDVFSILETVAGIYQDKRLSYEEKEERIHEVITKDKSTYGNYEDVQDNNEPDNKLLYCKEMLSLAMSTIDRSIDIIQNRLTELEESVDPNPGPESRGSKVFLISHLIRIIAEQIATHRHIMSVDEVADYDMIDEVVELVKCAVSIDNVPVRLNLIGTASIQDKLIAHRNLKLSVDSIITRCDFHKNITSNVGTIIMLYRVKILKYQTLDVIFGACKEIESFISSNGINTDADAIKAGFDLEHMDQIIKCLADINKLI